MGQKTRTTAAKGSPMTLRGTEGKGPNLKLAEVEHAVAYSEKSPAIRVTVQCNKSPAADVAEGFETAWADAVREINHMFEKYSEELRERALMDAAQVEELENVLSEALSLETHLKEKKDHLRRTLAQVSQSLVCLKTTTGIDFSF